MHMFALTSAQMMELDRKAVAEYGVDLLMMMENAGRSLALHAKRSLDESLEGKRILVMAGKGNNGGGGLAAARHLYNWGADVKVLLSSPRDALKEAPTKELAILEAMNLTIHEHIREESFREPNLIIDSLLGYNQRGNPRGTVAEAVNLANKSRKPILALDIPTGLDPDTGRPSDPCIKAEQTLTLAALKPGLLKKESEPYVGRLFLADISASRKLYREFGMDYASTFEEDMIVPVELE